MTITTATAETSSSEIEALDLDVLMAEIGDDVEGFLRTQHDLIHASDPAANPAALNAVSIALLAAQMERKAGIPAELVVRIFGLTDHTFEYDTFEDGIFIITLVVDDVELASMTFDGQGA